MKPIIRRAIATAGAIAATMALALGAATAQAADTSYTAAELATKQPLTVTSADDVDISAKTLTAIPLATYSSATHDGDTITGYTLADAGHAAAIDKALTDAHIDHATGYDKANPMAWVAKNLNDSATKPWQGKLRDLLTQLGKATAADGQLPDDATPLAKGADTHTMTAQVTPGIYLIVDTTTKGLASIPMMTGTGIAGATTLKPDPNSTPITLGTIEWKAGKPTIDKKIVENGQETTENEKQIGDTIHYRLKTTVPNWTGYDTYQLHIGDRMDKGLTFTRITKVAVGDTDITTKTDLWKQTDPTTDPTTGDTTFSILFAPDAQGVSNLVATDATKAAFPIDAPIVVEYDAILNEHAKISTQAGIQPNINADWLEYSHNPFDGSDREKSPEHEVKTYTGRFLINKTDTSDQPVAGAKFTISTKEDGTLLRLVQDQAGDKTNPAVYHVAKPDDTTLVPNGEMTTPASGQVTINGLNGTYTIKETHSPFGLPAATLPSFTLTVDPNHNGKNATVDFTQDANKLATSDGKETITVVNGRNLGELPKTGAFWTTAMAATTIILAGAGAILMRVSRRRA